MLAHCVLEDQFPKTEKKKDHIIINQLPHSDPPGHFGGPDGVWGTGEVTRFALLVIEP